MPEYDLLDGEDLFLEEDDDDLEDEFVEEDDDEDLFDEEMEETDDDDLAERRRRRPRRRAPRIRLRRPIGRRRRYFPRRRSRRSARVSDVRTALAKVGNDIRKVAAEVKRVAGQVNKATKELTSVNNRQDAKISDLRRDLKKQATGSQQSNQINMLLPLLQKAPELQVKNAGADISKAEDVVNNVQIPKPDITLPLLLMMMSQGTTGPAGGMNQMLPLVLLLSR